MYRTKYEQAFADASACLNLTLGTINTIVLLTSSLTMALAVHASQASHRKQLIQYLLATIVLGGAFIAIKGVEWHEDYVEDMIPFMTNHFHLHDGQVCPTGTASCSSISTF